MKKITAGILLLLTVLTLVSCGKKKQEEEPQGPGVPPDDGGYVIPPFEDVTQDPNFVNSDEYWANMFPDNVLFPFVIDMKDYENHLYYASDMIYTFRDWAQSSLNFEGWKVVGFYLVSEDDSLYLDIGDLDSHIIARKEYSTKYFTDEIRESMDPVTAEGHGTWPKNIYTAELMSDAPCGTPSMWKVENGTFVISLYGCREDDVEDLIKGLPNHGFYIDTTQSMDFFQGSNEKGFKLRVISFDDEIEITLQKPAEPPAE